MFIRTYGGPLPPSSLALLVGLCARLRPGLDFNYRRVLDVCLN